MMENPLRNIAPGKWRKAAYVLLLVVGTSITGAIAGYAALESDVPRWLIFTAAFYGSVTGPAWSIPASNIQRVR